MKAIAYLAPHELRVIELAEPTLQPGWVLIEVAAVGICGSDLLIWHGGLERVKPPIVMGHEFSGTVVDPNDSIHLSAGDRAVIEPLINCGECAACRSGNYNVCSRLGLLGIDFAGGLARYVSVPEHRVHRIPEGLDLISAALAEPTAVACHMVSRARVHNGDRVLIQGGGPIGALVASVARAHGVTDLVISEPNQQRRSLLESLGFVTVDPREMTPGTWAELAGEGFDVVFELTGIGPVMEASIQATRPQGTILMGGLPHGQIQLSTAQAVLKELNLIGSRVYKSEDFIEAIELLTSNAVDAETLVTAKLSLEEGISSGFERLEQSPDEMKILILPTKEAV